MFQSQAANIFGFVSTENNQDGLQKTAKFFNPSRPETETSSFKTQTTDFTGGKSSQSASEQQFTKVDTKRRVYNGKRVLSAHVSNRKKDCELPQLMSPNLVSLKSAPPVELIAPEYNHRPLLRNCISQESIRKRIIEPQGIMNFGGNIAINAQEKSFRAVPKKSPFFQNNCQNLMYTSDSELYAEKENCEENGDLNTKFRIKTYSNGGKVKVEKFNKIKVISSIPEVSDIQEPLKSSVLLKRGFSDKKILKIDTKKSPLQLDLEEPKIILHQYPQSSHSINSHTFIFPPNSATSKSRGMSPVLIQNVEIINRSNTPSSASLRRVPMFLNKCEDHEPLKISIDFKSPPGQDTNKLLMKRFQSERVKQPSISNIEIGGAGSPIVRVGSHMSFKRSAFAAESSVQSPTGPLDFRLKIQRGNSKFKNEEAVLNKLFNPPSLRKKE